MKNLMSMTDFVLEQNKETRPAYKTLMLLDKYAKFLKQPLELWMFVPCDEYGNVLIEPNYPFRIDSNDLELLQKYQQAKERCLFEGFEPSEGLDFDVKKGFMLFKIKAGDNVETLLKNIHKTDIKLTPTAIKQLEL